MGLAIDQSDLDGFDLGMFAAEGADFGFAHDEEGGTQGVGLGTCGTDGHGAQGFIYGGPGAGVVDMGEAFALHFEATPLPGRGGEGFVLDDKAVHIIFYARLVIDLVDNHIPARSFRRSAHGDEGAVATTEEGAFDTVGLEGLRRHVEGMAFANATEVEAHARLGVENGALVMVNLHLVEADPGEGGGNFLGGRNSSFFLIDAPLVQEGADGDVENPPRVVKGLLRHPQQGHDIRVHLNGLFRGQAVELGGEAVDAPGADPALQLLHPVQGRQTDFGQAGRVVRPRRGVQGNLKTGAHEVTGDNLLDRIGRGLGPGVGRGK